MRTSFSIVKANGTYLSPVYNVNTLNAVGGGLVTFEFYNDEALTTKSSSPTGTITMTVLMSKNSVAQQSTVVDCASATSVALTGVIYQLKIVNASLSATNFVNVIIDLPKST